VRHSPRVQEILSHTLALALGALRASGGLLEFRWNADHQTLEDAFDEEVVRHVSKHYWEEDCMSKWLH
jgi:hypothetical protein